MKIHHQLMMLAVTFSDVEEECPADNDDVEEDLHTFSNLSADSQRLYDELLATRNELRAFRLVHRNSAGKLQRRLARKTEKLAKIDETLGNDPDKVDFMRKVNRELADAQRKLLNLQFTWSSMESELTELEWEKNKGQEELSKAQKLGETLSQELEERQAEQTETDTELVENKEEQAELQPITKRVKGENLDGISREELQEMKKSLNQALAAIKDAL